MYELKVSVSRVLGACTAEPPMKPGDYFTVRDGDIRIPAGGYVCLWALQSLMPLLPAKERELAEPRDQDWMGRVHQAQCPDPKGRVLFKIARMGKVDKGTGQPGLSVQPRPAVSEVAPAGQGRSGALRDLRVVVERVEGKCTSGMQPGQYFLLRSGRVTIPAESHFCLYALQAVLPLLPAKQRALQEGDWLNEDNHIICPDPAGKVILRIEDACT